MRIITETIDLSTQGNDHMIDLTQQVAAIVRAHEFTQGNVTVFVQGSTAGVTTVEYEPGLVRDIPNALERIAPKNARYHHNDTWHDGNGYSHVRASLVGPSLCVAFVDGALVLGTWQQIVIIDFDTHARRRSIIVQIIGE